MEDNKEIIDNILLVDKSNWHKKIKDVIKYFKTSLYNNKELILQANKIDLDNMNGFNIDFNIIDLIFNNVMNDDIWYGDITILEKDDDKKLIYGKQLMDIGNVLVINDGNPYVIIEMILRNIKAGNTLICCNSGYMYGTNKLIIELIQSVLEKLEVSKYVVQMMITENYDDILNNYANIDLVIGIGNKMLQQLVINKSKNKVITSGYENYELYIDDVSNIDLIEKIYKSGVILQLYVKKDVELNYLDMIIVDDLDEVIARINYNGSRYNVGIITNNTENAAKFIREIKANMVTVNTSPTIERILDIKQKDLVREKIIIYPNTMKLDGTNEKIKLTEDNLSN